MTTWQEDPAQGDHDLDTPWGREDFLKNETVWRLRNASQFIRLCYKIVEEKQYAMFTYRSGKWALNDPMLMDMFSASAVKAVYEYARKNPRYKRKLLTMCKLGGPLYLATTALKAVH